MFHLLQIHLEEMADPRLRGTLSACISLAYCIGIMLISVIGFHISWKMSAVLGAVIALIALVGYSLLHESPVWFVRNNRISDAKKVYSWLWGSGLHVEVRHTHNV
jgi:predicted MFS family arabinose efflux permease